MTESPESKTCPTCHGEGRVRLSAVTSRTAAVMPFVWPPLGVAIGFFMLLMVAGLWPSETARVMWVVLTVFTAFATAIREVVFRDLG